ncbi:hypothetical protein [Aeromicrobium sp. Root495]|uniref:hypothetical protein n=1 Tax=Aeromicrobium sp. Root495 TaxID=1736550 RepID=UPI0012E7CA98|nr:hypothetical protein [Aeromicrobium sp. Root495]
MTSVLSPPVKFGLVTIFRDHRDTWSATSGAAQRMDLIRGYIWYFGWPTLAGGVFVFVRFEMTAADKLLPAVSVFTALMFAMLGLTFNVGVSLKNAGGKKASTTLATIKDLRANITWAILVAFALIATLVLITLLDDPANGTAWGWSPVVVALAYHLLLTLLTVLARFRTAFNYLTR